MPSSAAGRSSALAELRRWLLLCVCLLLPACYHMRSEPVAIQPRVVAVPGSPEQVLAKLRRVVEDEWNRRVLEEEGRGTTLLITSPYHFATDTGFGQPAGGRKYYMQLRIELQREGGQTRLVISPHNYEIRTSYAFGLAGQVQTLYKHYPYEEYPGMFDLAPLNRELDSVAGILRQRLKE